MYYNLFDSHVHSSNSPDGQHSVTYLAETAQRQGLMGIAVTDHVECYQYREMRYRTRIMQSVVDTAKARAAFRRNLNLSTGIEIGVNGDFALANAILDLYPFDFILGSVHQNRDMSNYYDMDYASMNGDDLRVMIREYLEDLIALIQWGNFDVLSHLDFPFRCCVKNGGVLMDLHGYDDQIEVILSALIERGKGLELNTSGLRGKLDRILPPLYVLRRFRELGGEIVTIGSDAHRAEHVGAGIELGMEMLEKAGFRFFAFYRKRTPVLLRVV